MGDIPYIEIHLNLTRLTELGQNTTLYYCTMGQHIVTHTTKLVLNKGKSKPGTVVFRKLQNDVSSTNISQPAEVCVMVRTR